MSDFTSGVLETATNIYRGSAYRLALGFDLPDPNAYGCTRSYGHPVSGACLATLGNLPHGDLPSIFTTRPREPGNNYITVPLRYADSNPHPSCAITIDLDGHSTKDVLVSVPWDSIRNISRSIIDDCVENRGIGGWETFGLKQAFDAVINPSFLTSDGVHGSEPVGVVNPDGSIDSVGFPEGAGRNPPALEIPLYMVVTISSPRSRPSRDSTDFSISLNLKEYLRQKYESSSSKNQNVQNAIARASNALSRRFVSSLMTYDHPRWWQFRLGAQTPEPKNVEYDCDAKLGTPGIGDCENLLYQFVRRGKAVLDPKDGPIIKTSGDCAIGILSKERHILSWDLLRNVAEKLILTCVASPIAAAAGGTAIAKPIRGRRKRQSPYPLLAFSRRDTTTASLPSSVEMFVYRQPPFPGETDQTCPWKVASTHEGDVKQCPAVSPFRPPERMLAANETVTHDGNITDAVNATTIEVSKGNSSEVIVGNMTGSLEELASISQPEVPTNSASVSSIMSSLLPLNTSASSTTASATASSFAASN